TPLANGFADYFNMLNARDGGIGGVYRQASRILIDDAPWGFVFSDTLLEVWQPYVRGYRPHPVWPQNYRDAWLDLPRRRAGAAR
ncbi:MAG: hypothetical protein AAF411_20885, partial [Myxococcota bacterium]